MTSYFQKTCPVLWTHRNLGPLMGPGPGPFKSKVWVWEAPSGGLFSGKKTPFFVQAWFACEKLPPGVYFLEKRHLFFTSMVCLWEAPSGGLFSWKKTLFLQAWFACEKPPPGGLFSEKRGPLFLTAWFACARLPPGVLFSAKRGHGDLKWTIWEVSGDIWRSLEAPGIRLGASGGIWKHLGGLG